MSGQSPGFRMPQHHFDWVTSTPAGKRRECHYSVEKATWVRQEADDARPSALASRAETVRTGKLPDPYPPVTNNVTEKLVEPHKPTARNLTPAEVATINAIKLAGEEVGKIIADAAADPELDQRWVAIAKTHLQQGFMALTRAVAKPNTF